MLTPSDGVNLLPFKRNGVSAAGMLQDARGQTAGAKLLQQELINAPLLILDEPTEGLDAVSERAVPDTIARLMRGRTTLLITRRRQALRYADAVMMLDQGKIRSMHEFIA